MSHSVVPSTASLMAVQPIRAAKYSGMDWCSAAAPFVTEEPRNRTVLPCRGLFSIGSILEKS